jgi:hypothetical protein
MSASRPVPLWLVLLAIPYWGAVAWLSDASPLQPRRATTTVRVEQPLPRRIPPPDHGCYRIRTPANGDRWVGVCDFGFRPRLIPDRRGDFPTGPPRFRTLDLARDNYQKQMLLEYPGRADVLAYRRR